MDVVRGVDALAPGSERTAVTIGFFDGVHLGHQAVMRQTIEAARRGGMTPVAVTFDRHPREVFSPGREPRLLTTLERKTDLVSGLGMERLVVIEFTEEFSRWSPERFADLVREGLGAARVVVGENFTFGYRAAGTVDVLRDLGRERGFGVDGIALCTIGDRIVSSSSIRQALIEGDLDWPARGLGRRFVLDGRVVRGAGRGRGLGWPTANLRPLPRLLLPGEGVYAGRARHDGKWHRAAINVGSNPTFGQEPVHLEAYLLDFDEDLLSRELAIEFWARIRDELKFDSVDALSDRIADDVERTREIVTDPEA